jgi:hypothetical protein
LIESSNNCECGIAHEKFTTKQALGAVEQYSICFKYFLGVEGEAEGASDTELDSKFDPDPLCSGIELDWHLISFEKGFDVDKEN